MRYSFSFTLSFLGVVATSSVLVTAFPDGAPEETCDSMRPVHHVDMNDNTTALLEPQTDKPYFSILLDKTSVSPGEVVLVTIQADQHYFEGFIIQARDVNEQVSSDGVVKKYGTFTVLNDETKTICNNQGLTHSVHKHFNVTTVKWTAPKEKVENIQFKATVVRGYKIFFMNVSSQTLNFSSAGSLVSSSILLAFMFCLATRNVNL